MFRAVPGLSAQTIHYYSKLKKLIVRIVVPGNRLTMWGSFVMFLFAEGKKKKTIFKYMWVLRLNWQVATLQKKLITGHVVNLAGQVVQTHTWASETFIGV